MFSHVLPAALLVASLAVAAPIIPIVPVTFNEAAGVTYTVEVTADGVSILTNHSEAVTSISMNGLPSTVCIAYGVDGSVTQLSSDDQNIPVGPPQTQISVRCSQNIPLSRDVPSPVQVATRQDISLFPFIPVTFHEAADVSYTVYVLANGEKLQTNHSEAVTSISFEGNPSFTCTAYGVDGSVTSVSANQDVPVGPPQTQVTVSCIGPQRKARSPAPVPQTNVVVTPVTFYEATGNSYEVLVPGTNFLRTISHDATVTSISMIGASACVAYGVDGSVTTMLVSEQIVDVSPPQAQKAVECFI